MGTQGAMLVRSTLLRAPAQEVWSHATKMEGVNAELAPLARMTSPSDAAGRSIHDMPLGRTAFVSWILLFGVLPVERWQLTMIEVGPGRRFLERSRTAMLTAWEHERTVDAEGAYTRVTDRVRIEPRLRVAGSIVVRTARILFDNRHRNLARMFGLAPIP